MAVDCFHPPPYMTPHPPYMTPHPTPSQDCCTELEARGAGAAHAQTRSEKVEQVSRDVPRTSYRIHGVDFGCAMGDQLDNNIRQKQVCGRVCVWGCVWVYRLHPLRMSTSY